MTASRLLPMVILTLALLGAPLAADAQQAGKVCRVGFLWDSPAVWPHALEGFRQGLRDTAKALGLTIPRSVLVRADQIVE